MAYEPYNWTTASYVNPGNMNHLEQGVAGASTTAEKAASDITKTNKDLSDLSGVVTTLNSNLNSKLPTTTYKGSFVFRTTTVTSNAQGRADISWGMQAKDCIAIYCTSRNNTIVQPYQYGGALCARFIQAEDGTTIKNTELTVEYIELKRSNFTN